jgi:Tfp pilus assembly protein PilO
MDKRKIDLLAAGIIIVLLITGYFAFLKDGWAKLVVLKDQKTVLSEKVRSTGDMALALERINREIDYIQKNLEDFDRQLPDEKRIYEFLVEIDGLAKQNHVKLEDITAGKLEKGTLYSWVPVTISANAGFRDFYRFLFQLEHIPRITMSKGLSVKSLTEGKGCNIEMDLAVFVGGT